MPLRSRAVEAAVSKDLASMTYGLQVACEVLDFRRRSGREVSMTEILSICVCPTFADGRKSLGCQPYSASERKENVKYRLTCKRAKPYFPFSFVVSSIRPMLSITALIRRLSLVSSPCKKTSVLRDATDRSLVPRLYAVPSKASLPPILVRQAQRYLPPVDLSICDYRPYLYPYIW